MSQNLIKDSYIVLQIYSSDPSSNAFPPSPSTPSGSPQAVSGEGAGNVQVL